MPAAIVKGIKTIVIKTSKQWFDGDPRHKIASVNSRDGPPRLSNSIGLI